MTTSDINDRAAEAIDFWFNELKPRDWFVRSDAIDARVRSRFLALHEQLLASNAEGVSGALTTLAAVIVLDQFSRNLFRDDARAFAADPLARQLATQAIAAGLDVELRREQRLFLYMPFEHSESLPDQVRAVALVAALGGDEGWESYALAHQSLIERFGRFPHRNALLGRVSTAAEIEAMKAPMGAF